MANNVYASRTELAEALGVSGVSGLNDRLDMALLIASRWVDYRIGNTVTQDDVQPPVTLTVVNCQPAVHQATLAAATRFYKSTDVPFGVAGGLGDAAVYIKTYIPEAEMLLLGQRTSWGIG